MTDIIKFSVTYIMLIHTCNGGGPNLNSSFTKYQFPHSRTRSILVSEYLDFSAVLGLPLADLLTVLAVYLFLGVNQCRRPFVLGSAV